MTAETFTLSNGMVLPAVGFGTCNHGEDGDFYKVFLKAMDAGYRYFDTASFYNTERDLGKAVRESGLKRRELMIASKVWPEETGYRETKEAIERSLDRLGTDYLDLYLIHWPKRTAEDGDWKENDIATWTAMEEYHKKGLLKAIGLSNFLPHHIMNLLKNCEIRPVVDQLELHIGWSQEKAVGYLKENGIQPQAWSPVGRGRSAFLESGPVKEMAEKYGVSLQKLSLRFLLQKGIMPLPLSLNPEHMRMNRELFDFEISEEDMWILSCMPQIGWLGEHPDFCPPVNKHVRFDQ